MIIMKIVAGPHAGRVREIPPDVNPDDLFMGLLQHGDDWQIDWSQATEAERDEWGKLDLVYRALRAMLIRHLPVFFMDKEYHDPGELEDAMIGKLCYLQQDDENGVIIGFSGYEQ